MIMLVYQSKVTLLTKYDFTNHHLYFQNAEERWNIVKYDGSTKLVVIFITTKVNYFVVNLFYDLEGLHQAFIFAY